MATQTQPPQSSVSPKTAKPPKFKKDLELSVTCHAPINIAVIKYWGKQDASENVPLNDSISLTLDIDCMRSETTIRFNDQLQEDKLILNGNIFGIHSFI